MFFFFLHFFLIVVLAQSRRTRNKSSVQCKTLTTQTVRSWTAAAKANGEHSKRTHVGATFFEHVHVTCMLVWACCTRDTIVAL